MTLRLQEKREFGDRSGFYFEYTQIEIESFRWGKDHEFSYVAKGGNLWKKLEPYQEIVGLGI